MYWINATTNPPKDNERIIGLDRNGVAHAMIFKDAWYYFDCDHLYAVNRKTFPLWYIPRPALPITWNNEVIQHVR